MGGLGGSMGGGGMGQMRPGQPLVPTPSAAGAAPGGSMNFGSLGESAEGSPGDSPWNISGESPNDAALASLLGDSDALPFALDVSSPGEEAPGRGGESGDAEIGAFVRALQDAPPLRNSESSLSCRTLSSAMLELRQLKEFVSFQS